MLHEQHIIDVLSRRTTLEFAGEVFRATRLNADPLAPSSNGGRWAPPGEADAGFSVLYTSLEKNGAIAEVASFLADQTPLPREQELKVTRLAVTAPKTMTFVEADFPSLEIDSVRFGERDYERTQKIGAALIFLGIDGLVAPSARWGCSNLMIYSDNHSLNDKLEVIEDERVFWRNWAIKHNIIPR